MKVKVILVFIWLTISYLNMAALWANGIHEFDGFNGESCHALKQNMGIMVFVAYLPIFGSGAALVAVFEQDGMYWKWWQVSPRCHAELEK